ncbi:MAG: hypothetical protein ROR55_03040 [Devosia sp.]
MSRTNSKSRTKQPTHIAYHAPDRENAPWTSIGAAWAHDDGEGLTLQLELLPASGGRIVLRTNKPKPA